MRLGVLSLNSAIVKLRLAKYAFLMDSGEAWQVFRELIVFVDKSGWTYTLRENVAPTSRSFNFRSRHKLH